MPILHDTTEYGDALVTIPSRMSAGRLQPPSIIAPSATGKATGVSPWESMMRTGFVGNDRCEPNARGMSMNGTAAAGHGLTPVAVYVAA